AGSLYTLDSADALASALPIRDFAGCFAWLVRVTSFQSFGGQVSVIAVPAESLSRRCEERRDSHGVGSRCFLSEPSLAGREKESPRRRDVFDDECSLTVPPCRVDQESNA